MVQSINFNILPFDTMSKIPIISIQANIVFIESEAGIEFNDSRIFMESLFRRKVTFWFFYMKEILQAYLICIFTYFHLFNKWGSYLIYRFLE